MPPELTALLESALRDQTVLDELERSPRLRTLLRKLTTDVPKLDFEVDAPLFTIKDGTWYVQLRTSEIFFFEGQGRKMAVKTQYQEISFYAGFDEVLAKLPGWFVRCHRGYIINGRKFRSASFGDMIVTLTDGSSVPFSRTYRDEVRYLIDNSEGT